MVRGERRRHVALITALVGLTHSVARVPSCRRRWAKRVGELPMARLRSTGRRREGRAALAENLARDLGDNARQSLVELGIPNADASCTCSSTSVAAAHSVLHRARRRGVRSTPVRDPVARGAGATALGRVGRRGRELVNGCAHGRAAPHSSSRPRLAALVGTLGKCGSATRAVAATACAPRDGDANRATARPRE